MINSGGGGRMAGYWSKHMRYFTERCQDKNCDQLEWEWYQTKTEPHRWRRRRICKLTGKTPGVMNGCPKEGETRPLGRMKR